jgi:VWFA-related protein
MLKTEDSSRRSRRCFLTSVAAAVVSQELFAAQQPTFSAAVNVVSVLANVTDKKGHIIRDLHRDDFSIFEDGRWQTIRYFTARSDLPLILGLMIDSSMSQEQVMTPERSAGFHFLDQVLRPNQDKMFLVQFDMHVMIKQELTSSWKQLDEALTTVDTPSRSELRNQVGGGTLLYDAIAKGSQILQNQRGRKALVVMTDGVDNGSAAHLTTAPDAAQKADTLVYSILFSESGFYGLAGGGDGRNVLQHLSKDSGGGFFEVSRKQSIDQIFDLIQNELRNQYSLGYVSDQPPRDFEFRSRISKLRLESVSRQPSMETRQTAAPS